MDITYKKISEITLYERNPRRNDHAVDYVVNSIKEFGFKVPIVIDKNNTIVCGHTRIKAAQKLDLKEVPCIIADDLTEAQIQAFRLADNKVTELADWDFELLSDEIDLIKGDFDIKDFGFEDIYNNPPEFSESPKNAGNRILIEIKFETIKDFQKIEKELKNLVDSVCATMIVRNVEK